MVLRRLFRHRLAAIALAGLLVTVLAVAFAPYIAPYDPYAMDLGNQLAKPSREHWLGTDYFGRDLFSRLLYGGRVSLTIGLSAVTFSLVAGSAIGLLAGYAGGRVDNTLMRIMDVILAFPAMMLAVAIIAALGSDPYYIAVVIGMVRVPAFARVVRSVVLEVREKEYVQAARALGRSDAGIVFRHVLPNVFSSMLVLASLYMATAITTESSLSFLGLGTQPPDPSWGAIAAEGREYMRVGPHVATFAGLAVFFVVWSLNVLGDALRDALDPKTQ